MLKAISSYRFFPLCLLLAVASTMAATAPASADVDSLEGVIAKLQPRMVKIYGAGGVRGLESYQSGFLISAEGHILTAWSYVLDTDFITIVLDDGRRLQGEVVGADPRLEIAVLKIDGRELPHFKLDQAVEVAVGQRVLAFSNLFGVATGDEPASVLKGIVSAITDLQARRGAFKTIYQGRVYVVDAMTNNPGAAGGAMTDVHGNLVGIIGKELRNDQNNTWLNYALPTSELTASVENILSGRIIPQTPDAEAKRPAEPLSLELLGVVLVPDVLDKTPPFIDQVVSGSPAEAAGLRPDDLILFVDEKVVQSSRLLRTQLSFVDRANEITVMVQRDQSLFEVKLRAKD